MIFFLIFLTKASEQHNGRLFVVVYLSFISDAFRLYRRLLQGMNTTDIGQHIYSTCFVPPGGRGSKVTILVGFFFFNQECCQWKELPKKRSWDTFLLEIGDLTQSVLFWWAHPTPLRSSSMSLLPREAQNLLHSRFSCMLIPFSMFSLDHDEGKVKYSPLYGRGSRVTILVSRHFQSGITGFNSKCIF